MLREHSASWLAGWGPGLGIVSQPWKGRVTEGGRDREPGSERCSGQAEPAAGNRIQDRQVGDGRGAAWGLGTPAFFFFFFRRRVIITVFIRKLELQRKRGRTKRDSFHLLAHSHVAGWESGVRSGCPGSCPGEQGAGPEEKVGHTLTPV